MDNVMTPFVVNSFYFCDPDGKTEYVGSKNPLPVDDRTPSIKRLKFKDIKATNCHVAGAYICGLPEMKIEELRFENIDFNYAENAKSGVAAMMLGCDEASKQGLVVSNIKKLILKFLVLSKLCHKRVIHNKLFISIPDYLVKVFYFLSEAYLREGPLGPGRWPLWTGRAPCAARLEPGAGLTGE